MDQRKPTTSNSSKKASSKTAFIKSQPRSMAAIDIVNKAKQAGLTMTSQYVYKVRSEMNKTSKPKTSAKPGLAKKTATGKARGENPMARRKTNLAAFVRGLPRTLTAKDVVAKAIQAGLRLSPDYVWRVRGATNKRSKKAKPATARTGARVRASSSEATFRRLVLDLGVQRSKQLCGEVEHRLAKLIGGK